MIMQFLLPNQRKDMTFWIIHDIWYFEMKFQMVAFEKKFHGRPMIPPKVMDFPFFCHIQVSLQPTFEFPRIATIS